jgi:ribose 5-phosphate isomerase B
MAEGWPARAGRSTTAAVGRAESGVGACEHAGVRVAFGTDEVTSVTASIQDHLAAQGHEVVVVGEGDPWPDVGRRVGEAVASGQAERGIACCWTGTGVAIAANKVPGVRAALCGDAETARGARRWNDANVVTLGLRLTSTAVADEIVDVFLGDTDVDADERRNIDRLEER